jgi:hypothetical protein
MFTMTMLIAFALVLTFADLDGARSFVATFRGEG